MRPMRCFLAVSRTRSMTSSSSSPRRCRSASSRRPCPSTSSRLPSDSCATPSASSLRRTSLPLRVSSSSTSLSTARSGSLTPSAISTRRSPSPKPSFTATPGERSTGSKSRCRSGTSPSPVCTETWTSASVTSSCASSVPVPLVSSSPPTFWPVVSMSSRFPWSSTLTSPQTVRTTSTALVAPAVSVVRELPSTSSPREMFATCAISSSSTIPRSLRCP
mmetsp:Transcript_8852/g.14598  ORF Transcript_8852/g.14598 Transcript_8852/m.14598 type:complete len:219 (+) Transcript_8852:211-867(+)